MRALDARIVLALAAGGCLCARREQRRRGHAGDRLRLDADEEHDAHRGSPELPGDRARDRRRRHHRQPRRSHDLRHERRRAARGSRTTATPASASSAAGRSPTSASTASACARRRRASCAASRSAASAPAASKASRSPAGIAIVDSPGEPGHGQRRRERRQGLPVRRGRRPRIRAAAWCGATS